MQVQLLKNIVTSFAGESAAGLVDLLHNKKNVNEFLIAKKLNLTINQTRNILYRLADEGLVSFIRKKDSKKGGWYTYFWTLNSGKGLTKFREKIHKEIANLQKKLDSKLTKIFYYCANCDIEYNEENALINEYTCPECGEILQVQDSREIIERTKKDIENLETLLKEVDEEIGEIQKKEGQAKTRRLRKEEKEKEAEKLKKKKKKERERKKLAKDKKGKKEKNKKGKKTKVKKKDKNLIKKIRKAMKNAKKKIKKKKKK